MNYLAVHILRAGSKPLHEEKAYYLVSNGSMICLVTTFHKGGIGIYKK
jgi:hypothetical protein